MSSLSSKFGHHMAPLTSVSNLATRWHHLHWLQRSRGLSWSPSNYEELGWKRYFLMSEWDQNGTRTSVAIDINTRLPSVAIMYPLWLPHSHNVAELCAFLTYFYHLSHTAVTVIIQTGPSRVPNLPHIGLLVRYLFLPLWAPIYGRGWSENDYFYGKIASKGRASSRVGQPTWKVSSAPYHIPIHGRT